MKRVACGTLLCWMLSIVVSGPAASEPACGSFPAKVSGPALDLAPPRGFVEVCSLESEFCTRLKPQFANARVLGFFANQEEWKRYKESGKAASITRLLVAQWSEKIAATFPELQKFMRSSHTLEPSAEPVFGTNGQADLAVFEDAKDSIATGSLKKGPVKPGHPQTVKALINAALLDGSRVLLLTLMVDATASPKGESAKVLTSDWLRCLRAAAK